MGDGGSDDYSSLMSRDDGAVRLTVQPRRPRCSIIKTAFRRGSKRRDYYNDDAQQHSYSLFARLSDAQAIALHGLALRESRRQRNNKGQQHRRPLHRSRDIRGSGNNNGNNTNSSEGSSSSWWHISKESTTSELCSSGIEFLPLKVTFSSSSKASSSKEVEEETAVVVYTSYNGGQPIVHDDHHHRQENERAPRIGNNAMKDRPPCIELPTCLIPTTTTTTRESNNTTTEDSQSGRLVEVAVSVVPLYRIRIAQDLWVEPVTYTDWILLQAAAEWLESGGLLQQVSVVYCNQILEARVNDGRDTVRVRILPRNFEIVHRREGDDDASLLWPDDDDEEDEEEDTKDGMTFLRPPCLRLVADSQIIVVPKTQKDETASSSGSTVVLTLHPSRQDYANPSHWDALAEQLLVAATSSSSSRNNNEGDEAKKNATTSTTSFGRYCLCTTPDPCSALVHPDTMVKITSCSSAKHDNNEAAGRHAASCEQHGVAILGCHPSEAGDGGAAAADDHHYAETTSDRTTTVAVRIGTSSQVPLDSIVLDPCSCRTLGIVRCSGSSASGVVVHVKEWLNPGEVEERCDQLRDALVRDDHVRPVLQLALRRVQLVAPAREGHPTAAKPWHYCASHQQGTTMSKPGVQHDQEVVAVPSCCWLDPPPRTWADAVLQIGSLLQLPWRQPEALVVNGGGGGGNDGDGDETQRTRGQMYRIVLVENQRTDPPSSRCSVVVPPAEVGLEGALVRARDLAHLLSSDRGEEQKAEADPVVRMVRGVEHDAPLQQVQEWSTAADCYLVHDPLEHVSVLPSALITRFVQQCHTATDLHQQQSHQHDRDALICGPPGSGKTQSALVLAAAAAASTALVVAVPEACPIFYLDCKQLRNAQASVRLKDIMSELHQVFYHATSTTATTWQRQVRRQQQQKCVLILDDLDEIAPHYNSGSVDSGTRSVQEQQGNPAVAGASKLVTDFLEHLKHVAATKCSVKLIVTCSDGDSSISPGIRTMLRLGNRSHHRGGGAIQLPLLTGPERQILYCQCVLRRRQIMSSPTSTTCRGVFSELEACLSSIGFARRTEGFLPNDMEVLAVRVCHQWRLQQRRQEQAAATTTGTADGLSSLTDAMLKEYVPLRQRSVKIEPTTSTHDWSDIGGLYQAKQELTAALLRPIRFRRIYQHISTSIRLARGILLFGPPGCGKSYLVPALAKTCQLPLIACRGPELLDKYIGASEAAVRNLFARAAAVAPSILFLDEFDALAPKRGSDLTGVTDRVVNQLLTFLDGVEDNSGKEEGAVHVVAATSRPDKIDPALVRPGRLERHVYVGPCREVEEWTHVMLTLARRYPLRPDAIAFISSGQFAQEAIKAVRYNILELVPADCNALLCAARLEAVHETLSDRSTRTGETTTNDDHLVVAIDVHHLMEACRKTRPSVSRAEAQRLEQSYRPFRKNYLPSPSPPLEQRQEERVAAAAAGSGCTTGLSPSYTTSTRDALR